MAGTVADRLIDRFLKDVDAEQTMPWQRPYSRYNAFNYFTLNVYRGINRLMLPFGEYMTAKQINEYNKTHHEDFRFQKGIVWYPVVYYKSETRDVSLDDVLKRFKDYDPSSTNVKEGKTQYIGKYAGWSYFRDKNEYFKHKVVLRSFDVAERKHFKNSKGELLPSRLKTGEVEITLSEPKKVVEEYLDRENITVEETRDVPCWNKVTDVIKMNNHCNSQEEWFSVIFHEMAHSTGHPDRLDREGCRLLSGISSDEQKEIYAKEECIAEIAASLCCAECGIHNFETSCSQTYKNNIAYVQSWKKRVKDWGKEFIFIASQADRAFNRIMNFGEE